MISSFRLTGDRERMRNWSEKKSSVVVCTMRASGCSA